MKAPPPRWLVAAAGTLALAVSAGVTAPAASANNPQKCSWQPLTLTNGWQSANIAFGGTGDPSYCVENGIVYLSGSLYQPTPGNDVFASLSTAARPTSTLYLPVYTLAGSTASLTITSTGTMSAWNLPGQQTATEYTSGRHLVPGGRRNADEDRRKRPVGVSRPRVGHRRSVLRGQERRRLPGWLRSQHERGRHLRLEPARR